MRPESLTSLQIFGDHATFITNLAATDLEELIRACPLPGRDIVKTTKYGERLAHCTALSEKARKLRH